MTPEEVDALGAAARRAYNRAQSARGLYQKTRRDGAPLGLLVRLREDYFEKLRISIDLERKWFVIADRMDSE